MLLRGRSCRVWVKGVTARRDAYATRRRLCARAATGRARSPRGSTASPRRGQRSVAARDEREHAAADVGGVGGAETSVTATPAGRSAWSSEAPRVSALARSSGVTAVIAPQALRGGVQVMVGVYLPFNRIFIIILSIVCVLGIYFLLFRSNLGVRVRAVTQNRNMSACLGIPTRKVDSYTFAFASGLAGIAGWALTMVGNVDPGLGQN